LLSIDIWSDIVCPWCWIGEHRLDRALKKLGIQARWRFHAFELGARVQARRPVLEHLAGKYGVSLDEASEMTKRVQGLGAELGLDISPGKQLTAPTFDAHRLVAARQATADDARALVERLHKAHFSDGLNVGDKAVLAQLAVEAGLDGAEAQRVLDTDAYTQKVEEDLRRAAQQEIRGVPFFVLDMKIALNGAQPVEAFERALKQAFGA
jgi:predicted DsbA family dithiol-disulfide isomerase